jgi:hypothetical protein
MRVLLVALTLFAVQPVAFAAGWVFACSADNDLLRVVAGSGMSARRFDSPEQAVAAAAEGDGVLLLAEGYPERPTAIAPDVLAGAADKRLRFYIEYPAELPGVKIGSPKQDRLLRGVVSSGLFGAELPSMRIVTISGCSYLPVTAERPHLVLAKVAGVDAAVFGLKDTPFEPLLFERDGGRVMVATTKLSHFVTGRFMPDEAWRTIWHAILSHLQPGVEIPALRWTPTVRPWFGRQDVLPVDVEAQALRRSVDWLRRSRILRHPKWPSEALAWGLKYNTVRERPGADWPLGDGAAGIVEGFSSTIRADGSQPMRYAVRNDCMGEVAMLLALADVGGDAGREGRIAGNLADYILGPSGLATGYRLDPDHPAYGLIGWALDQPDHYWGDDNARSLLGLLTVASCRGETRWNDAIIRNLLANFRTTGVRGFRESCLTESQLREHGWRYYWRARNVNYAPHMAGWLWACFLWGYEQTGFEPFLTRAESGARLLMAAYPNWDYTLGSGSIELARALLPLAWLVRVRDTPEHREWLRFVASELLALQDSSGAIREVIRVGGGAFKDCLLKSNAAYGTSETSLIQVNGDPVADMLYTCNFALIGLHEAFYATREARYAEAEDKLAKFLCRIQVHSETHPELDGAWYRAFNFKNWQYWASNADWEWGPWCTETGWTQPWIGGTLALRQKGTSLWEVTQRTRIQRQFDRWRREMLPEEAIAVEDSSVRHVALGKSVRLGHLPDRRYPGAGPGGLVNGEIEAADYRASDWLGYLGEDLDATIDLGAATSITTVGLHCLQSPEVGIFLPGEVRVGVSDDGVVFRELDFGRPKASPAQPGARCETLTVSNLNTKARFVRIRAVNLGTIPAPPHPVSGVAAWLFVDEILVGQGSDRRGGE